MKLQFSNLVQRNGNHPHVNGDTDSGIDPTKRIDIDTMPRISPKVLCPVVRHGGTLEDGSDDKYKAVHNVEDGCSPEQASNTFTRKDIKIEERQAEFDKTHFRKV